MDTSASVNTPQSGKYTSQHKAHLSSRLYSYKSPEWRGVFFPTRRGGMTWSLYFTCAPNGPHYCTDVWDSARAQNTHTYCHPSFTPATVKQAAAICQPGVSAVSTSRLCRARYTHMKTQTLGSHILQLRNAKIHTDFVPLLWTGCLSSTVFLMLSVYTAIFI